MLAFSRYGGESETDGIYVIPALGGAARRVCKFPGNVVGGVLSVTWAPDGKSLLLGNRDWLGVVQVETGEESKLALPIHRAMPNHRVHRGS